LEGLFICENLQKIILKKGTLRGYVHSVFKNACNIQCEDLFITLLSSGRKMSPMSITVGGLDQVDFSNLYITQGLIFEFSEDMIYCDSVDISISMNKAKKWSSSIETKDSSCLEHELLDNIGIIGQGLKNHGKLNGMGPLINKLTDKLPDLELFYFDECDFSKSFEFIEERFLNFIDAVIKANVNVIGNVAKCVIGFGCGLTPSMDDFISGVMISYIYMGIYYKLNLKSIYEFNSKIISSCLDKTTRVSSEMLKHSSVGEINEAVKNLMTSIFNFDKNNEDENHKGIIKSLIEVIEYGETSGTDTAFGIYLGLSILTNLKYRRVWINESLCGY